ncbi:MAG: hypothetical protein Q8L88_01915 [Bacteroidota bacterium]|nr:hypothetical protein [Bacteroidota bacterium]
MKKIFHYSLSAVLFAAVVPLIYGQDSQSNVQPFLPEIISRFPNVRDLAVSTEENEIYFTAQSILGELSAIVTSKKEHGKWSAPEIAAFSGMYQDLEPFLSPNGLRLYFVSNRPNGSNPNTPKNYDIWFVERKNKKSAWSAPKNLGAPVNTNEDEFYPSVAVSNNLYFTRDGAGSKSKDDIFFTRWENGTYAAPVSMSDSINSTGYEFNAFVAPDESFLLYTCYNRAGGSGSGDLYISYNKGNNEWTTAENLRKEINSPMMDYCPFVDTKSGILYFTSKRSSVKTQFERQQNIKELLKEMTKYENGQSRIYKVNAANLINKLSQ